MRERFEEHLRQSGLLAGNPRILVGYSGGADSTCLLHLLHGAGLDIVAGHLHHGQRPEADREMALCEAFCQELDVPILTGRADVPVIAERFGIGLEEAGRNARYHFFEQAAFQTGCPLIATAHTLDDHVETVLLNLARGSGLAGLTGIPERRGNIVRPLLPFTRAETRAYCAEHGLWFHDDPTNDDLDFARARVRHRVLPELTAINPRVRESVARLSAMAGEEVAFLDGMAAAALEAAEIPLNGPLRFLTLDCEVAFRRVDLLALPSVLRRRAVRLAVGALGGNLDYEGSARLVDMLQDQPQAAWTAEGGEVVIEWEGDVVHLRQLQPVMPFRHKLTVPGDTESDEFGWRLTAAPHDPADYVRERGGLEVVIDADRARGTLYFRTAQDGDAMAPLGMEGTRKLSDLLSESGLTLAARKRLPIVCDLVGPLWVPGAAMADRVKIDNESRNALRLSFGPL